MIVCFTRWTGW